MNVPDTSLSFCGSITVTAMGLGGGYDDGPGSCCADEEAMEGGIHVVVPVSRLAELLAKGGRSREEETTASSESVPTL